MSKSICLLVALALGALIPELHVGMPALPWLVGIMLLFAFSGVRFARGIVSWLHLKLILATLVIGGVGCLALWHVDRDLAIAALICGITPTATAATVVMQALGGEAAFVAMSAMLSNLAIILIAPVAIHLALGEFAPVPMLHMLARVAMIILVPLAIISLLRQRWPGAANALQRRQSWAFSIWLLTIVLIAADTSRYLHEPNGISGTRIVALAGVALAVCLLSFGIGAWLGGPHHRREASQALGQKNTSLGIWMAATFANPMVALAPTCYVLWHNLVNAVQLARRRREPDSE